MGLVILVLSTISAFLDVIGIGMILPLIALMTDPSLVTTNEYIQPWITEYSLSDEQLFFLVLFGFVVLYFFSLVYRVWLSWLTVGFVGSIKSNLSNKLFARYIEQPWLFHQKNHSASMLQNVTREVELLAQYGINATIQFAKEALLVFVVATTLVVISPIVALVILVLLAPLIWLFQSESTRRIKKWASTRQQLDTSRLKYAQEALALIKEIKLRGCEPIFSSSFASFSNHLVYIERIQAFMRTLLRPSFEMYAVLAMAVTILVMTSQGASLAEIAPILGFYAVALIKLLPSITTLLSSLHLVRYVEPVVKTLSKEFHLPKKSSSEAKEVIFKKQISLHDVDFSYPEASKKIILNAVNIEIKSGEFVAFIGETGSGKSTLINIILGILSPTKGQLQIDGQIIGEGKYSWLNNVAYLDQSVVLMDTSIRNNIIFNCEENEELLWQVLESAQLVNFIRSLPNGLDTAVGERGATLSGGERQRLGIARALYLQREVLILDEPTSALDIENEQALIDVIKNLNKTIIMITHKQSLIQNCDKVFSVSNASVSELRKTQKVLDE